MATRLRIEGGGDRFQLYGELDFLAGDALHMALASVDGQDTTIDLSGVTFLDSGGLHHLIEQKKAHGGLRFANPSPRVRRVVDIVGLSDFLFGD
jgi:anti-anti-sigma factor